MSKVQLSFVTSGVIIGIVGTLHGAAEVLRGNEIVEGNSVEAMPTDWPNPAFYDMTRGSPVFSILTDLPYYGLGLTAITVSIAMIVYSAVFFRMTKLGIGVFALLSLGVFLFGAGRGTPIALSIPLVIFGLLSLTRKGTKKRSPQSKNKLSSLFSFLYGWHIFSWVLFFPILFIYGFYQPIPTWLFVFDFASMPIASFASLVVALMYDRTATD